MKIYSFSYHEDTQIYIALCRIDNYCHIAIKMFVKLIKTYVIENKNLLIYGYIFFAFSDNFTNFFSRLLYFYIYFFRGLSFFLENSIIIEDYNNNNLWMGCSKISLGYITNRITDYEPYRSL